MIAMWMGKNVDEMTREEAIAALKLCGRLLAEANSRTNDAWQFHREVTEISRGRQ